MTLGAVLGDFEQLSTDRLTVGKRCLSHFYFKSQTEVAVILVATLSGDF
jgi:hypothetical protein